MTPEWKYEFAPDAALDELFKRIDEQIFRFSNLVDQFETVIEKFGKERPCKA